MMSLSNGETDEFKPFDLKSLDAYDQEKFNRTEKTLPDFDRFQMLFEPKTFEEDPVEFTALYNGKKEKQAVFFKPLIEKKKDRLKKEHDTPGDLQGEDENLEEIIAEPEESPEEKGYQKGYEDGFAKGLEKGEQKGHELGFEEGRVQGFEKGEQEGFQKGEQEGLEKGFEAGEEKGEQKTREKAVLIIESLEQSVTTIDTLIPDLVNTYEDRVMHLIRQIVQKAVMATLETDDEIVKPMILDALKSLVEPEQVVLRVSEEDYQYIEMVKDEFFDQVKSLESVSVISDPSVKRGGCRIDTNTASIACDPMERLEAIFEAIKDAKNQ